MNDPSPSIHTSTEPLRGLSSPRGPISPCTEPCPPAFLVSSTMSPQETPTTVFTYIKDHLTSGGQARRWSLMESADMSVAGLGPGVWGKGQSPSGPMKTEAWPE